MITYYGKPRRKAWAHNDAGHLRLKTNLKLNLKPKTKITYFSLHLDLHHVGRNKSMVSCRKYITRILIPNYDRRYFQTRTKTDLHHAFSIAKTTGKCLTWP